MAFRTLSVAAVVAGALALPVAIPAQAQGLPMQPNPVTNPVPAPEAVTIHAKTAAINPAVNLVGLHVDDSVNAQYSRSVAFVVSASGAPAPENEWRPGR